jgi:pilus assembly protein Flp/PilA
MAGTAITLQQLITTARRPVRGSRGASLVEYALLAALIAIVCLTAVFFLGNETSDSFDSIGSSIDAAT